MLKIIQLFNSKQKRVFFLLLGLITIASILEMTSLAIIVPIINSFLEIKTTTKEIDFLWFAGFFDINNLTLLNFLIFFLIFFIVKSIFSIFVSWKHYNFVINFIKELSFNLYSKYLSQNYKSYKSKNSSELLRNILKEIDFFYLYLQSFIQIILESIILLGIVFFLLYLLLKPTLLIIISSFIFASFYYFLIKKKINFWGESRQNAEKDRIRFMQEGFSSIKEINFFNRNNFFTNRFKIKNDEFYNLYFNFNFFNTLPRFIFELFTVVIIALTFIFLLYIGKPNEEIIKILAIFFVASFRIIPSIYRIVAGLQNLRYTNIALETIYADINKIGIKKISGDGSKLNFKNKVNLKIAEYTHTKNNSFKLKNIDLEIHKNQKIGIIGRSGSGKSTIIDMFSGIITDKEIKLSVDDSNINDEKKYADWQRLIGLIPQNISVLNETFRQNILFGLSEKIISDKEIINTIKISNLTNLLARLPKGIDQIISEKGSNLSGGEIQRIGIARALIFNPEILIFDEATSALDTFTENEILKDINSLPNKTILMISHRMNTLKYCDKIYLVDNGKIIDEGPYSQFKDKY
jgi:ATP-binding cassette, subfamily B, bacterial PglK